MESTWASPAVRATAILRGGALRPPVEWQGAPVGPDDDSQSLANYLAGLWHYLFFSFGAPYPTGSSTLPPAFTLEVDTEYLIVRRGARVVRDWCLDADDIGVDLMTGLGREPGDDDWYYAAFEVWRRNAMEWSSRCWTLAHETLVPRLTLGGQEALDFLASLPPSDFGTFDILLKGSLALTEPGVTIVEKP